MDGKQKFLMVVTTFLVLCFTLVFGLLFFALWPYRSLVGLVMLALLVVLVLVFISSRLNEQALRRVRYHHDEETPLDAQGEAHYWPAGALRNPHRIPASHHPQNPYAGYQTQQRHQQGGGDYGE